MRIITRLGPTRVRDSVDSRRSGGPDSREVLEVRPLDPVAEAGPALVEAAAVEEPGVQEAEVAGQHQHVRGSDVMTSGE